MTVRKRGNSYTVEHCSSGKKGVLGRHKTRAQANRQHRAIQANKKKRG